MTGSILDAILVYSRLTDRNLANIYSSSNRINQKGDQLEYFVKDIICDTVHLDGKDAKEQAHKEILSWVGTSGHPPDAIIRGADAVEVKNSSSKAGQFQLNSSPPHRTLQKDNPRITEDCKTCEDELGGWEEKDLVYAIGKTDGSEIEFMWLVYGDCWVAEDNLYPQIPEVLAEILDEGVQNLTDEQLQHLYLDTDTNDIARVRNADELNRTQLRVRPMWILKHPAQYYRDFVDEYDAKIESEQPLFAVMRKERFREYPDSTKQEAQQADNITISEHTVPDPSDSSTQIECVLIEVT